MAEVRLHDGETIDSALRRFKMQVLQEDIIKESKRRTYYLKPGDRRRRKSLLARKRNRRKKNRDRLPPGRVYQAQPGSTKDAG